MADIILDLASENSNLYFSSGNDFEVINPDSFMTGGRILPGYSQNELIYKITKTGQIPGMSIIHASVKASEIITGRELLETTEPDSGATILIQTPAQLRIDSLSIFKETAPNYPFINQGQSIEMIVTISNLGQEGLIL